MSYRIAHQTARRSSSFAVLITFATLGGAAGTARAQDAVTSSRQSFTGLVGVGVAAMPTYRGSDEYRVLPVPVVQLEYRGRAYLGGSKTSMNPGVGAYLVRTPGLTWDVGLSGDIARPESRGDALAGMGKRSAASFATTGVAYRLGFAMAIAGAGVGLGNDAGSYASVGVGTELPLARRWVGGISTGVTFADARNMAFEFGVTSEQSATRQTLRAAGDPRLRGIDVSAYAPGAGLKDVRGTASLAYVLTQRSRVQLFAQGTRLSGEAARSPLVRARTGVVTGAVLAYGF